MTFTIWRQRPPQSLRVVTVGGSPRQAGLPSFQRSAMPDPRTATGKPPRKFTIELEDRRPKRQLDLFSTIVNALENWVYFADETIPIFIKLCPEGLRQAAELDMLALRRVLWGRYFIHMRTPIHFLPKEAIL